MLKKYKPFFRASSMNLFAYKFQVFSWFLISAVSLVCTFFLWIAVYHNSSSTSINGFNIEQIISYILIVNIVTFSLYGSDTLGSISDEIRKGQIAMFLIKPISYRVRFVFSTLGSLFSGDLIIVFPALIIGGSVLITLGYMTVASIPLLIANMLLFIVAQVFAVLIMDSLNYMFGIFCFYTLSIFGLGQIKDVVIAFFAGQLIPVSFFPDWAAKILSFSPFVGMAQNPALIFLGRMTIPQALFSLLIDAIWLCIFETINHVMFNHAIKKITIQGG